MSTKLALSSVALTSLLAAPAALAHEGEVPAELETCPSPEQLAPLLPDLQTMNIAKMYVTVENGRTLLRFDNSIANKGAGHLQVTPVNIGGTQYAVQQVLNDRNDRSAAKQEVDAVFAQCWNCGADLPPTAR